MRTDDELMLSYRGGEQHAFELLFDRYREPIWRFFRRRIPDAQRSEELTQETFLALLRAAHRYQPRSSFRSYLFGIAFNLLAAARREDRRVPTTALDDVDVAAPGCDATAVLWVRQALSALDDEDREVLMLREYDQLSYDEIAALVRVPVGTVRSRLFRARLALRDKLVGEREAEGVSR
ncbi:MAG TPA: sigma-70 family RNA polymerase sigma factor [Vicinamibacterales bacterium]|nr:sigma-70 family RNA polymerase sigma factor [Vicinamibacterales bacterium]